MQRAYTLREQLTTLFDTARSKVDGLRRIRFFWRRRVEKGALPCFTPFLKPLDMWCDHITNDFIAHATSDFVEELSNKLKVLKRRCYRLRTIDRLFQRLTLDIDGYRRFSPGATPLYLGPFTATLEEPRFLSCYRIKNDRY